MSQRAFGNVFCRIIWESWVSSSRNFGNRKKNFIRETKVTEKWFYFFVVAARVRSGIGKRFYAESFGHQWYRHPRNFGNRIKIFIQETRVIYPQNVDRVDIHSIFSPFFAAGIHRTFSLTQTSFALHTLLSVATRGEAGRPLELFISVFVRSKDRRGAFFSAAAAAAFRGEIFTCVPLPPQGAARARVGKEAIYFFAAAGAVGFSTPIHETLNSFSRRLSEVCELAFFLKKRSLASHLANRPKHSALTKKKVGDAIMCFSRRRSKRQEWAQLPC